MANSQKLGNATMYIVSQKFNFSILSIGMAQFQEIPHDILI